MTRVLSIACVSILFLGLLLAIVPVTICYQLTNGLMNCHKQESNCLEQTMLTHISLATFFVGQR